MLGSYALSASHPHILGGFSTVYFGYSCRQHEEEKQEGEGESKILKRRWSIDTTLVAFKVANGGNGNFKLTSSALSDHMKTSNRLANQEFKILNYLQCYGRCPFLIQYYDSFLAKSKTGEKICLVFEYLPLDLFTYIEKYGRLNEKTIKSLFKQLIQGVYHMHSLHVLHCDLKLENLLVGGTKSDNDSKRFEPTQLKITDFGLSSFESEIKPCRGSPVYAAPELFLGEKNSTASDIWACGVILFALLFNSFPFNTEMLEYFFCMKTFKEKDIQKIKQHFQTPLENLFNDDDQNSWTSISIQTQNLLRGMLEFDPKKRWNVKKIRQEVVGW